VPLLPTLESTYTPSGSHIRFNGYFPGKPRLAGILLILALLSILTGTTQSHQVFPSVTQSLQYTINRGNTNSHRNQQHIRLNSTVLDAGLKSPSSHI